MQTFSIPPAKTGLFYYLLRNDNMISNGVFFTSHKSMASIRHMLLT
jgi:hypothetical protein